jgi:hypothetical protein
MSLPTYDSNCIYPSSTLPGDRKMKSLSMMQPAQGMGRVFVRSIAVGVIYALTNALVAALLGEMSRLAATWENVAVWALTGTFICLSLCPLILHSSWSRRGMVLAVWAVLALVRSVGLGIEGALFKPTAATGALVSAVVGIFVQLWIAWLVVWLLKPPAQEVSVGGVDVRSHKKGWWGWVWRVIVGGLAYFVFYFVFGAANAFLYTMSFYKDNPQYGLAIPPAGMVFLAQLIRGPLMVLGASFLAQAVSVSRRQLAVWLGILLFVVGGVAPYVEVTFRTMPLGFNLATLAEILCQNFLTGVVVAYLFGAKQATTESRSTLYVTESEAASPQPRD